jgi:hypothetical protein
MRYPSSEKPEIIRLVEQTHLPVRRTLQKLGIPRPTPVGCGKVWPVLRTGLTDLGLAHGSIDQQQSCEAPGTITHVFDLALLPQGLESLLRNARPFRLYPEVQFLMLWTAPTLRHRSAIGWLRESKPH